MLEGREMGNGSLEKPLCRIPETHGLCNPSPHPPPKIMGKTTQELTVDDYVGLYFLEEELRAVG